MHDRYAQCFIVNSVELAELGKHFYTLHDQLLELLHNMRQFYIKKKTRIGQCCVPIVTFQI